MTRKLYELVGADPTRRFSPFCWRSCLALAHKGLDFETVPWRFGETERLAFAHHDKVPVLVDGERVASDSWAIAEYLEANYPDRPALFGGALATMRFVSAWADGINPALVRLIVSDIPAVLGAAEQDYFRSSREKRFGMPLEAVTADREQRLPAFRALLQPLRATLAAQPYLGGTTPDYGDYMVFGSFQWARCVSPFRLLATDDPVHAWRERMLDLYGGMARLVPAFPH
ncbi:glutathione S-transferase [Stella humosa]|uniref:Glutathione S-transferase n=1 Tax=Stella humosa TaxID=94 RepID=A0A3N1L7J3_9PROT|nr:glutathione S-transferase family protein [Stella humosa]ROP90583.1 glutathione S-transferase [Stella humosa]BBK29522.1 glutathione S-transferase [Stella humosa]